MKETILAFGSERIMPLLKLTFAPQGMEVRCVSAERGKTLAMLAAQESGGAGESLPAPMLVFCGFTPQRMDRALQAMHASGLVIPYKAMLTATNRAWTPQRLFDELRAEHEAMQRGGRAHP